MVSYVTYFCLILKICFYALILSSGMLFIIMKDVYNRVYQCLIRSGTLPAGDWLDVARHVPGGGAVSLPSGHPETSGPLGTFAAGSLFLTLVADTCRPAAVLLC